MKNTLQQQLAKLQENKVLVAPNAYIVRHQLVYSGKGKDAIVMTPVTSEGLEELLKFREDEKAKRLEKLAEKTIEGVTQWNNRMPWEQSLAEQYVKSILN